MKKAYNIFIIVILTALNLSAAEAQYQAQLRDVGIIGLMSHDIFTWDRKNEVNTENGRLDLSTIFDYDGGKHWETGGNPKNSENAPVYTVTMSLVQFYKNKLNEHNNKVLARQQTVQYFHSQVFESFERFFKMPLPKQASSEPANNAEQAALRALHDILPGRVKLFHRAGGETDLILTDFDKAKTFLNEDEMNQPLKNFDGDYDIEYKNIKIPFVPVVINLMEVDKKFIEKFSPYRQADMLKALADMGSGKISLHEVFFIQHVQDLLTKSICSKDNAWMPNLIICK